MPAAAEGVAVRSREEENLSISKPPPPTPDTSSEFQTDEERLAKMFSKLNPSAKEFVPSPRVYRAGVPAVPDVAGGVPSLDGSDDAPSGGSDGYGDAFAYDFGGYYPIKKANRSPGRKKKVNQRVLKAQREDIIKRTVYVHGIYSDFQVTEELLALIFGNVGQVLDCRICGDPFSQMRFAFVEFSNEESAKAALDLDGTVIGIFPIRVSPSKTAILPVNPTFLPQTEHEKEMCTRTVYVTNIATMVSQLDIKNLFESSCGQVSRLRLLADHRHSTFSAFVEFVLPESALMALNCSGVFVGDHPIRVSPSKTPVRSGFHQGKQQPKQFHVRQKLIHSTS